MINLYFVGGGKWCGAGYKYLSISYRCVRSTTPRNSRFTSLQFSKEPYYIEMQYPASPRLFAVRLFYMPTTLIFRHVRTPVSVEGMLVTTCVAVMTKLVRRTGLNRLLTHWYSKCCYKSNYNIPNRYYIPIRKYVLNWKRLWGILLNLNWFVRESACWLTKMYYFRSANIRDILVNGILFTNIILQYLTTTALLGIHCQPDILLRRMWQAFLVDAQMHHG